MDRIDIDAIFDGVLKPIHASLQSFTPQSELMREVPEQITVCAHLLPTDCVLELGGSIGRNSCVINSILEDKTKHLVIEPSVSESQRLALNRSNTKCGFHIVTSAVSNVPLFLKGWHTFEKPVPDSIKVNTVTYPELQSKYNMNFNVLVIDNEGNFVKMMKAFDTILDNIRMVIIEHDFNSLDDLNFFKSTMTNSGFNMTSQYLKTDKYGPGDNWVDGVIGDPTFVSVWKRNPKRVLFVGLVIWLIKLYMSLLRNLSRPLYRGTRRRHSTTVKRLTARHRRRVAYCHTRRRQRGVSLRHTRRRRSRPTGDG